MNYEHAAAAWASLLDQPFDTDPFGFPLSLQLLEALFRGIHPETIEQIEIDPHLFAARVAAYRHNLASPEL